MKNINFRYEKNNGKLNLINDILADNYEGQKKFYQKTEKLELLDAKLSKIEGKMHLILQKLDKIETKLSPNINNNVNNNSYDDKKVQNNENSEKNN